MPNFVKQLMWREARAFKEFELGRTLSHSDMGKSEISRESDIVSNSVCSSRTCKRKGRNRNSSLISEP